MTPGANVSAVARAHRVSPQQVFAWRRKAIRSGAREASRSAATPWPTGWVMSASI
nr:transposase [Mesorhizobium alhagi]